MTHIYLLVGCSCPLWLHSGNLMLHLYCLESLDSHTVIDFIKFTHFFNMWVHLFQFCVSLIVLYYFLGSIAVLRSLMRPIVINQVAWSVGWSVCHTNEPCKNGWTVRDVVELRTRVGSSNYVLHESSDAPMGRSNFERVRSGVSHCKV